MARYGSILNFCRALMNRDAVHDRGVGTELSAGPAHKPAAPKMAQKLLLQHVTRLYEQTAVDGLVRHAHGIIMGEGALKANSNLAR